MKKISILTSIFISILLIGCGNIGSNKTDSNKTTSNRKTTLEAVTKSAENPIEISIISGEPSIDIYSYEELAGDADYVIIGKVLEEVGIEYLLLATRQNDDGMVTVSTIPYTDYSVQVVENMKGDLRQDEPILIRKRGGLAEDESYIFLHEDDLLPLPGNTYVFYIYAQLDGTNMVAGTNSTIPLADESTNPLSTRSAGEINEDDILALVRQGVENQIVTDRDRSTSNDSMSK